MSDAPMSEVPLTSAGLSGSAGSAATRSHSTRSADCACADECSGPTANANRARLKPYAIEPERVVMMPCRRLARFSPRSRPYRRRPGPATAANNAPRSTNLAAPPRRLAADAILGRFRADRGGRESFGGKPALEQLAHGGRSAGHTLLEAEIVDQDQFIGAEHDLKALSTQPSWFRHGQSS